MNVVSFTNLYPNAEWPNHGIFVRERLARLRSAYGWRHRVLAPVPFFPRLPGFGRWSEQGRIPRVENDGVVPVAHPRYFKLPGIGLDGQAQAMAKGARKTFERWVEEARPDVIDAHYLYPDAVAASILAAEHSIPLVATARGSDVNVLFRHDGPREQIAAMMSRARFVCGVSQALCERLRALAPEHATKVVHAPNGVDLDRFSPAPSAAARTRLGLPLEGRVLLFVGRLVRTKGVHELVAVLPSLPADVTLLFVGGGPERAPLQAAAEAAGVAARVRFAGEVAHAALPDWYRAADRFVFPSYSEGHPNVVCEALASGLPVVASRVGGIPEIVDESVGEVFEVDPEDVSRGLGERLLPGVRHSLERSYRPADLLRKRSALGWDAVLKKLGGLFEQAAGRKGTASSAEVPA